MLTIADLFREIAACAHGQVSLDEFEEWFAAKSRGAYSAGDAPLREAIVSVEEVFSKYYFQGLSDEDLLRELVGASRRFADQAEVIVVGRR